MTSKLHKFIHLVLKYNVSDSSFKTAAFMEHANALNRIRPTFHDPANFSTEIRVTLATPIGKLPGLNRHRSSI